MSENFFDEMISKFASDVEKNSRSDTDYIASDGLSHCGKCHAPKQIRMKFNGMKEKVLPVMCDCMKADIAKQEEAKKRDEKRKKIEHLRENSLIDKRYENCSFETITVTDDNRKQVRICKRYAVKFEELYKSNQGLLLYGDVGTGKTVLACCIANYLMEHLHSVYSTSFVEILRHSQGFNHDEKEEIIQRRMRTAELVILDDLGAERGTDYGLEVVYNIIDGRYRSGKPMIVTTNLSLIQMQNPDDVRYARIYQRVLHVCYPVMFAGKSFRLKEAANRYDAIKSLLEDM